MDEMDEGSLRRETDPTRGQVPDGSTDITQAQKARTEALPDGSGTDADNSDQGDTASGGPA